MFEPHGPPDLQRSARRQLAAALFNYAWALLETPRRTREQDDEMIHAAHAARYHWGETGEAVKRARGEWLCSRVYASLDRSEPALYHAERCLGIVESLRPEQRRDWDVAAALEALARAHAVAGDRNAALTWKARAATAASAISGRVDREDIEQDIETLPV